jgi:hypothetical protein
MPEVVGNTKLSYSGPAAGQLANLFGATGIRTNEGFEARAGKPQYEAPTLFDYETMQELVDFIRTPQQIGEAGVFARSDEGPMGLEGLKKALADYNIASEQQRNVLAEGLDTGFRVDVDMDPIREAAMYKLKNEIMPGISEGFAGTAGLASSDFGAALAGAGVGATRELAALEAQLNYESGDAAAGRRSNLLQAAPAITTAMLGTPSAWAESLADIENTMRQQEEQTRPGAREYEAFMQLIGADPGGYLGTQPHLEATGAEKFGQIMGGIGDLVGSAGGLAGAVV